MKTTSLIQLCSFFAIAVFATVGVANGSIIVPVIDSVIVQGNGVFPVTGAGAPASTLGTLGTLAVRERENQTQLGSRVASLIQLDLSGLAAADVNDPTFNVTFSADVVGILNSVNGGFVLNVGRNQSGAWSSTAGSEPSFFAGLGNGTVTGASDVSTLIPDVRSLIAGTDADGNGTDDGFDSPNIISADITSIVVDWFNNGGNDGLVLFAEDPDGQVAGAGADNNGSQGAYLDSISVLASVAAVPEPSSLIVLGLGMAPVLLRRRRN